MKYQFIQEVTTLYSGTVEAQSLAEARAKLRAGAWAENAAINFKSEHKPGPIRVVGGEARGDGFVVSTPMSPWAR